MGFALGSLHERPPFYDRVHIGVTLGLYRGDIRMVENVYMGFMEGLYWDSGKREIPLRV